MAGRAAATVLFNESQSRIVISCAPNDTGKITAMLTAKNIPHQISPDGGSLLVPEDKLDASRLETAAAGLPRKCCPLGPRRKAPVRNLLFAPANSQFDTVPKIYPSSLVPPATRPLRIPSADSV